MLAHTLLYVLQSRKAFTIVGFERRLTHHVKQMEHCFMSGYAESTRGSLIRTILILF